MTVSERSANEVTARSLVSGQPSARLPSFLPSFLPSLCCCELVRVFFLLLRSFLLTFCLFVVSECRSVGALVEWCRKNWCWRRLVRRRLECWVGGVFGRVFGTELELNALLAHRWSSMVDGRWSSINFSLVVVVGWLLEVLVGGQQRLSTGT